MDYRVIKTTNETFGVSFPDDASPKRALEAYKEGKAVSIAHSESITVQPVPTQPTPAVPQRPIPPQVKR